MIDILMFIPRGMAALYLFIGLAWLSRALIKRLALASSGERWLATGLVMLFLSQATFHLLIQLQQFKLLPALVLNTGGILLARKLGLRFSELREVAAKDLRRLGKHLRILCRGKSRWIAFPTIAFLGLQALRLLLQPVQSWDSLTYHGLKAALWVQGGEPISYSAPGSWGLYKQYLGGGETWHAWAMLPFHTDTLVAFADLFPWLLLGLAIYCLGRRLGIRARARWVAALYLMLLPAMRLTLGSCYVDPQVSLAVLACVHYLIGFIRKGQGAELILACLATAVACSTKLNAWAMLAPTILVAAAYTITHARMLPRLLAPLGIGLVLNIMLIAPWLIQNAQETGYPLGHIPLSIAGVELGKASPEMEVYVNQEFVAYQIDTELKALSHVFYRPKVPLPHLSMWSLPVLAIGAAALLLFMRRRWEAALLLALCAGTLYAVYQPSFSAARIGVSQVLGRFLFPLAAVLVISALTSVHRRRGAIELEMYLVAGALIHLYFGFFFGWSFFEKLLLLPIGALVALAIFRRIPRIRLLPGLILLLLSLPFLQIARDQLHLRLRNESYILHRVNLDWLPGLKVIEATPGALRIAHTAGPHERSDHWMSYPFLGNRYQHDIVYVPISTSGERLPRTPGGPDAAQIDFASWDRRLSEEKINYVISFSPTSTELGWMEAHPERFTRHAGDGATWGLYALGK